MLVGWLLDWGSINPKKVHSLDIGEWQHLTMIGIGIMIFKDGTRKAGFFKNNIYESPLLIIDELEDFLSVFHLIKQGHSKNLARSLTKPEERLVLKMLQTRIKSHLSAIEILAVELTEEEMAQLKETFRAAADRNSHPSSAAATTEGGGSDLPYTHASILAPLGTRRAPAGG